MKAVGDLIQLHSPDLICFQEVTLNIYDIFQQSSWWKLYRCLVSNEMAYPRRAFCMQLSKLPVKSYSRKPFSNSTMERDLCVAEVEVQADMPLVIATSHLKSPGPGPFGWDEKFCKEHVDQAKEALAFLKKNVNVIFCGDMNWDDYLDGQFPLLRGWVDAWVQLKPGENGWTYDTKSNQMLFGDWPVQKPLDRFVCNLSDFKIRCIDMIGTEAIPGLSFCKEKKVKNKVHKLMLHVFPSDHYGKVCVAINTTVILECKGSNYPVLVCEEQTIDKATISSLSPSRCLGGCCSNVGGSLESIADCIGYEEGVPAKVWSKVVVNDGGRGTVEGESAQNSTRMEGGADLEARQIRCGVESAESEEVAHIHLAKVTDTWKEVDSVVEETNNVMGNSNVKAAGVQVPSMMGAAEIVSPCLDINVQKQVK